MDFPEELVELWRGRGADPAWFKEHYEAAVGRLEDHRDIEDPYVSGPHDTFAALLRDGTIQDEIGGQMPVDRARDEAFELLALADIAEALREHG
jgi:hypothetical protein